MSFVYWLAVRYMYHDPVRCVYRYTCRWRKSRRSKNKHLALYLYLQLEKNIPLHNKTLILYINTLSLYNYSGVYFHYKF